MIFTSISASGFGQGEFNNWYFGYYKVVTFNGGNPLLLPSSPMETAGVSVNVSDSAGNILFYSNGMKIYNRSNAMMPHGDSLFGNSGSHTQSIISVKAIDNDTIYFLFTAGRYDYSPRPLPMVYSVVNMNLAGNLGDIDSTQKNIPLPGGKHAYATITGTRHANNKDAWIVVRLLDPDSNYYASYRVTSSGVDTVPVLSPSAHNNIIPPPFTGPAIRFMRISPDGKQLICNYSNHTLEVCYFNDTTGQVTSRFLYPWPFFYAQQMEFSIDSKVLYVTGGSTSLYQFDATKMDSLSFAQSAIQVGLFGAGAHSALQMAPDGKIYGTRDVLDSLWVVHYPSVRGIGCGYQKDGFCLQNPSHADGLPQFIQRYKVYIHNIGNCENDSVIFSGDIWPLPDSLFWDFGDPLSGTNNFSNLENPVHIYSAGGNYRVRLFVRHIDQRTDTTSRIITILSGPPVSLGPDKTICTGGSYTFNVDTCTGCSYLWGNLTTGQPNIGTGSSYTSTQAGIYMVTVTGINGCRGRDTVQLFVTSTPSITNDTLTQTICSGEMTNIVLTSNVSNIGFSWTVTLNSGNITGFSADSGLVISQTLINHLETNGIITYHVVPKLGSCIGDTADFLVTVNPGDSVKVTINASINNVCAGTSVIFTAIPTNPGTNPAYQWKVNGTNIGTNDPNFIYTPSNGEQISCILTSSISECVSNNPAISDTITMIVNPNLPVSVSVSASENPVCEGTLVTFTATPTNGGANPSYQWKVNGSNVGTNSPVFTYVPLTNDNVQCVMTSSELCTAGNPASSNQVSMIVNPNLQVSVSVTASANPVCEGTQVTFMATPTNGGSNPSFQWQVNGVNAGTNSPTYTYIPVTGDEVICDMTSSETCTTNNPASSIPYPVSVIASPYVDFTRCFDSITTINAKPIKLKGGIPLGGIYSGPGVISGYFYPNIAGVGNHTIIYTYPAAGLCSAQESVTIVTRNAFPFTCSNQITDPRDGKVYSTVQIGSQCWMAENLNYGYPIDESTNQRDNCIPEKFNRQLSLVNSQSYYQWDELMGYDDTPGQQGLCPPGWHVPTESDWHQLFSNWENSAFAGSPLKATGYSGFNAEITGAAFPGGSWNYTDLATFFWSSTPHGTDKAMAHGMNSYNPSVSHYLALRANAFSVRCVRD